MRFYKIRKKYNGFQWGMKLNLVANLVQNKICHVFPFLECLQPIIVVDMCIIVINVFELGALNHEFQYLYP
jgi:hypothetical protein